jgi:hypothetical protein
VSPGHTTIPRNCGCSAQLLLPNLRCHLTFIRFAGPRKERIHLGAAIAAVVAAGVDDVSNFPSIRELAAFGHRPARRIPP